MNDENNLIIYPALDFILALDALKSPHDLDRLKSLDKFLEDNKEFLLGASILTENISEELPKAEDFTIRGSSFKVTEAQKTYATTISNILGINKKEALKIIAETSKRNPEINDVTKTKKYSNEEIKREVEQKNTKLFISSILRERRTAIKLLRVLVSDNSLPIIEKKFSEKVFQDGGELISTAISSLEKLTDSITENDSKYSEIIASENALAIIEILKLLVFVLIVVSTTSSNVVKWFGVLQSNDFFAVLKESIPFEFYEEIDALKSVLSLLFLGLNTNDALFDPFSPFILDSVAVKKINKILVNSPVDPLINYAWSISIYGIEDSKAGEIFGDSFNEINEYFAVKAAEQDVFKVIEKVHQILHYDNLYSAIVSSFLIAVTPFIKLTDKTSHTYLTVFKDAPDTFVEKLFTNEDTERILFLAKAKFPEIIIPYLRLLTINGAFAHDELSKLSTYMHTISSQSLDYENEPETDSIVLKSGLYVNPPYEQNKDVLLYLPDSTRGKLVPTTDPKTEAAIFHYNYNGWALIGRVLQNIVGFAEDEELLLTILELIGNTISSVDLDTSVDIFESLSSFVDNGDIVEIILKLFEQSLHQKHTPALKLIVDILIGLVNNFPQIVWSHLARSDLLEHGGRGGLIATILGSIETVNGEYDFTIALLKLYNELVSNALSFPEDYTTQRNEILPKFTSHAIQIFENFIYWNYKISSQKFQIGTLIIDTFSRLLYSVYGIDPDSDIKSKVTKVLAQPAEKVIKSFTNSFPDVRTIKPILAALNFLVQTPGTFDTSGSVGFWYDQWVRNSLVFSKLVLSIRSVIGSTPSTLEKSLFAEAPALIDAYSQHTDLRGDILQLLTQLVSASWPADPPSLLSHLGEHHTSVLLASISSDLELKYDDFKVKKYLYDFFSAVIEGNQKGLSMIFLNGRDIRDTEKKQKTVLGILKNNVTHLDYYPESLSIHLVEAIAHAFNSWSSKKEESDVEFITTLVNKLKDFQATNSETRDEREIIQNCYKYMLNSRVAEICALFIFTSKEEKSARPITDLLSGSTIVELIKPLYQPFGYRVSLHENLNRNFEDKWPTYSLKQFIRSPLANSTRYGENAVYDLRLLDDILGLNEYWAGSENSSGYRGEVISASLNLQYVSSQISAAKSWGALLTAYVKKYKSTSSFVEIIKKLLQANIDEGAKVPIFEEVYRVRIELSFFFLYSITSSRKLEEKEITDILSLTLQLVTSADVDFLGSILMNKSDIYRPLLRIISSLLTAAKNNTKIVENLSTDLLNFFEIVIAKGTSVILGNVQAEIKTPEIGGKVEDLYLIISLYKGLIASKPPTSFTTKLSTILVDFGTLKAILNVYSSSHLLKINNEPLFADLTLTFMLELASVDSIAEQLISSGLFSTLIQSPISLVIQEGNITVQSAPRYHNIWSNGLLAIILILLSNFGARLLPEILVFVNYFAKQITSTLQSWSQDSLAITVPALQETEQIIILQKVLKVLSRDYGMNLNNMQQQSTEIIPELDSKRGRKTLSDAFTHLLAHPKFLTSRIIPTTLEEQRSFEGEDKIRTPLVEQLASQISELKQSLLD
ncbi:Nucleoporin [Wickerhamomyces ciferrii]|uniref:Nucleoporin NUP188 n=1 Tax=Wickerhamomyces ciferrii (strain ATCC 14091 / BCRC 22168 / CBS 111 / JCM 3599 / NBRC 0793 / NRRL Y-1031 F-60-10) TaxID=1206466 RepID=K0KQK0_WICCF|nr:Nucleoporin [Wickerhamomyces ciferrii]CCH45321.1 Nucleoporin [Wickerhamomyces ciferrii]